MSTGCFHCLHCWNPNVSRSRVRDFSSGGRRRILWNLSVNSFWESTNNFFIVALASQLGAEEAITCQSFASSDPRSATFSRCWTIFSVCCCESLTIDIFRKVHERGLSSESEGAFCAEKSRRPDRLPTTQPSACLPVIIVVYLFLAIKTSL